MVSQHALSINGKRDNITMEDLLVIGESIKNKKAEEVTDEISEIVSQWKEFSNEVGVDSKLRDAIDATLIRL